MGLDEFKSSDTESTGNIKTRKQIQNVKLSKKMWKHLLANDPGWAHFFCGSLEDNEVKAIVQTINEILENGVAGQKLSEEEIEQIELTKKDIVQDYL